MKVFIFRCVAVSRTQLIRGLFNAIKRKGDNRGYVIFTQKYEDRKCLEKHNNNQIIPINYTSSLTCDFIQNEMERLRRHTRLSKIQYHELNTIAKYLEENHIKLNEDETILLLNCCSNLLPDVTINLRQNLTSRIWNLINESGCELSLKCYHALLTAYAENFYFVDPYEFLKEMVVEPDANTYTHLLNVIAKNGNIQLANNIVRKMQEENYPLTEDVYKVLLEVHSRQGDMKGAKQIIQTMEKSGQKPSSQVFSLLACGYARNGDIVNVINILKNNEMDIMELMNIIKALSTSENGEYISDVINLYHIPLNNNESVVRNTITELAHMHKFIDAYNIINFMPCIQEDNVTMVFFADHLLELMVQLDRPFSEIMEIVNKLVEAKKYTGALLRVTEIILHNDKINLALAAFDKMKSENFPIRAHYYWPLFIAGYEKGGESNVWFLLKHLVSLNLHPDHDTLCNYVLPYINTTEPFIAFKKLRSELNQVTAQEIWTALLSFLLYQGRIEEFIQLQDKVKGGIIFSDIKDSLMKAYKTTHDIEMCLKFFAKNGSNRNDYMKQFIKELLYSDDTITTLKDVQLVLEAIKKHKLPMSSEIQDALKKKIHDLDTDIKDVEIMRELLDNLSRNGGSSITDIWHPPIGEDIQLTKSGQINRPKELSKKELTSNLEELKYKNLNMRGTLRKLLMTYCNENNLQEVENVKKEMELNSLKWSAGMRAALFGFYAKNYMLKEATEQLHILNTEHSDVRIDYFKILLYATVLVKHDKINDAFDILRNYGHAIKDKRATKSCWELLNTVAHSKNYKRTKDMLEFFVTKGYCNIDNKMLGPLITADLLHNDITSAVNTFKKCAKKYNLTPLRCKLLSFLIKEHSTHVEEVLHIIEKRHGSKIAHLDLLLAFAECGKVNQLQDIIKKAGITVEDIIKAIEFHPAEKKLEILLNIINSVGNLYNIHLLYEEALSLCNETRDCQTAVSLWEKLTKVAKPSRRSLQVFINLLEFNKIPLPSDLKLTKEEINLIMRNDHLKTPG